MYDLPGVFMRVEPGQQAARLSTDARCTESNELYLYV
jgi:hypothetical protein